MIGGLCWVLALPQRCAAEAWGVGNGGVGRGGVGGNVTVCHLICHPLSAGCGLVYGVMWCGVVWRGVALRSLMLLCCCVVSRYVALCAVVV